MATPADVFNEINRRLAEDPSKAGTITGKYQFDLSGDGGGSYHVVLGDGVPSAGEGVVEAPNTTVSMTATDFVDLASGKLDGTMAYMTGKLKIKGDMGLAMKLQSVLAAARAKQ